MTKFIRLEANAIGITGRVGLCVAIGRSFQAASYCVITISQSCASSVVNSDRIVVLIGGRVAQFGTPMALYHHPKTKHVVQFIDQPNINLIPATVSATDATGERVEVGIRPEHVRIGAWMGSCASLPGDAPAQDIIGSAPRKSRAIYKVARGSSDAAALLLAAIYPVIHNTALALGLNPDTPETLAKVTQTT